MSEATDVLRALIASRHPIGPTRWGAMARALSRSPGFLPSTLLIALFGTTLFVNALIGPWRFGPIESAVSVATWLTWGSVSCLAMSIGCIHSLRNIRRLGVRSLLRFRLWFELGRLSWNAAFLGFVLMATGSFVGSIWPVKLPEANLWLAGKAAVGCLVILFAIAGTIGYALALARWRLPTGRAFECVHFFLPLVASGCLLVFAVDGWPPPALWPEGILLALAAVLGCFILGIAFVVTVRRR